MQDKENFSYTYSASEQAEIKRIRKRARVVPRYCPLNQVNIVRSNSPSPLSFFIVLRRVTRSIPKNYII